MSLHSANIRHNSIMSIIIFYIAIWYMYFLILDIIFMLKYFDFSKSLYQMKYSYGVCIHRDTIVIVYNLLCALKR